VKQKPTHQCKILEGCCAGPEVCPLSQIKAGTVVAIKQLTVSPEMGDRLREMGFCEEQQIKLLARNSSFISRSAMRAWGSARNSPKPSWCKRSPNR
jgi:hypothetical protein